MKIIMKALELLSVLIGWAAFVLMGMFSIVAFTMPGGVVSGLIFLIVTVACFPAEPVKTTLKKIIPSRELRDVIIAVLFIAGCMLFPPDSDSAPQPVETVDTHEEFTEKIIKR